jgi:hypothetical protein
VLRHPRKSRAALKNAISFAIGIMIGALTMLFSQ